MSAPFRRLRSCFGPKPWRFFNKWNPKIAPHPLRYPKAQQKAKRT